MSGAMSAIGTKRTSASCTAHVRFRSKSGHAVLRCKCLLLTQSGHGRTVGTYVKLDHAVTA